MSERRKSNRQSTDRRHPLRGAVKLRPSGPALDRRKAARPPNESRQRLTVEISAEAVERLRDAVYWTEGVTLAGLVESCIVETVRRMELERGSDFARRERPLRAGRPPK